MSRTVNLVIGLAIVVGISIILFGSIGGKGTRATREPAPPSGDPWGTKGGLPQLDMAAAIVGPSSSPPPPIPATARFSPRPRDEWLEAIVADPRSLTDQRWERARQRLRRVFGGALSAAQETAVQAAVATWVDMQVMAVAAHHDGYIDAPTLGLHTGWNRNAYLLALEDALGNEGFQRYARIAHEDDRLDEIDPF